MADRDNEKEEVVPVPDARRVQDTMAGLEATDPRYRVLKAALGYKAAWVVLAEHLSEVYSDRHYRNWGYKGFNQWVKGEVQLGPSTAKKLIRGYRWLQQQAPQYIPRPVDEEAGAWAPPDEPVPDYGVVNVLAEVHEAFEDQRVNREAYDMLRESAFDPDTSAAKLRRDFEEAIPEHLREQRPADPLRPLRLALSAADKVVERLAEAQDEEDGSIGAPEAVFEEAIALRDHLYEALAAAQQEQAEALAEAPDEEIPGVAAPAPPAQGEAPF